MKRTDNYIGTVKNDAEGWQTIEDLRNVIGASKLRFRGRRPNREELMKRLGRNYSSRSANKNDINWNDLLKLRESDPALTIAIYGRRTWLEMYS